ncbi:MAG: transcriptional regulator, partial [Lachnospiraceae bacterium]|nr:transcriptional regulator [Lachnospiraceae bacterium]
MTTVFIKLLNMSIAASWLVLSVILFRIILKNAPKWIRCILWGLVAIRLICPISMESIFSLLPSAETIPQDIMYTQKPTLHTGVRIINSVVNPYISESMASEVGNSVNPMQIIISLGTVIWIAGMIGLMVYAAISYFKIKSKAEVSLLVRENIYLCDYIDTPFVLGVFRPRIYLPSALAEDDKAEFVIAHETAHIRRRDHWWKPLGFLLLTVYWFNPLIWVAYILLCRDIELACDEHVIDSLNEGEKKTYSEALLSCSMRASSFHRNMISACPLAFGEVGVKDRVKAVLHYKRPAFRLVVLAVLACTVAAICFLTNPKESTSNAPEPFGHSYRVEEIVYGDGR